MTHCRIFALLVALSVAAFTAAAPAAEHSYVLATATTGGTYYPVGVALATLVKVKLEPEHGIGLTAIDSAGSGENVKLLRENQAQFAIIQGLYGAWAWDGEGRFEPDGPQRHLRSVSMLWQNVEHFVIAAEYAETGTIDDIKNLQGKKFSIGRHDSGAEGSNRIILTNLSLDPDSAFEPIYLAYGQSAAALQNRNIEGMSTPGGVPVSAVAQAFAARGDQITLLGFTDEQRRRANGKYRLWTSFSIAANTYPGQSEAIRTIAQPNFLAVHQDVPEEDVYLITKAIYENLPFLNNIHVATTAMDVNKALEGLPIPLHPGAARYFQEVGIAIPEELSPRAASQAISARLRTGSQR